MSKSIVTVMAITALTTALAVGGVMHVSVVNDLNAQIKDLTDKPAELLNQNEIAELQSMIDGLSVVPSPNQEERQDAPDNWIYGNPTARFTLVEMTDTECPYCKQHFPILKSLIDSSAGQINAALLHVPAISDSSRQQALAIECAGEQGGSEAAWKYAQRVFDATQGNGGGVSVSLSSIADDLNLERLRFSQCMDSTAVAERVMADMEQAIKLNIQQTPSTMVIDNISGNSIVLQGTNASQEGILSAMAKVSGGVK